MILGLGTDIVNISRIESLLEKWRDRFINRVFTRKERDYCMDKKFPSQHFAARFAAKEAFLKALGVGLGYGISMKDIEVTTNSIGNPSIVLHGKAKEACCKRNMKKIFLSLSHDGEYGIAQVILEG